MKQLTESNFDAFGRLRVSEPQTLFDTKHIRDAQANFWDDQQTSGSGTTSAHQANQASMLLSVSLNTAGTRVRQTFRRFSYQPGKSQLVNMTFVLGNAETGITKRVGLFDENNGFFLQQDSGGPSFVKRSKTSGSVVDQEVQKSDWNIDKMDGTGPSKINIDFTTTQILVIDFQYLGVGSIRYGFSIGGVLYYCHEIANANVELLPYMSSPNLPLRIEISASGTNPASSIRQICATVISEGGREETGFNRMITRGATPIVTANDALLYPAIAVRLGSGFLDAFAVINDLTVVCTSTATYHWYLIVDPVVTGTAFSFSALSNSALEYDASRLNTTTVSGGTVITGGVQQSTNEGGVSHLAFNEFALGSKIDGTAQIVVLAVQRLTGTTESFYTTMDLREKI